MIEYEYLSNNIDYNDAHQNECRWYIFWKVIERLTVQICGLSTIKVLLTTKNQMLPHVDHPPPPQYTQTQPHSHHTHHTHTTLTTLPHLWSPSKDMTIMLFEHLHFYLSLDFWLHVYAITAWWQTFSLILSNHPAVSSSPFLKFFFHIMNKSQWGIFTSRDTVTLAVMEIGSEKERPLERARACTPSSNI